MLAYRGEIDPLTPLDDTIGALAGTFSYPFSYGYSCVGRVERSESEVEVGRLVFAFHPHQDRFVAGADHVVEARHRGRGTGRSAAGDALPARRDRAPDRLEAGPVLEETVVVTGLGWSES